MLREVGRWDLLSATIITVIYVCFSAGGTRVRGWWLVEGQEGAGQVFDYIK